MKRWLIVGVLSVVVCVAFESQQCKAQSRNPGRSLLRKQLYRSPSVSPYLNLLREQGLGLPTYQTLVRPQLEQRRVSRQQAVQIQRLQTDVARNAASSQRGEITFRPTGHQTVFRNYLHYFPQLSQRR